jgi:hypothetical protein
MAVEGAPESCMLISSRVGDIGTGGEVGQQERRRAESDRMEAEVFL